MRLLKKLIDFYIYSSIHIALGAFLSVILCYSVFIHIPQSDYPLFVFCATVFLYCTHRVIGIEKVKSFQDKGRFAIIKQYRIHLIIYIIVAGAGMIFYFLRLDRYLQLWLLLPGLVSLLYVLPLFGNKKRLRDYFQIKIFLISIIWGLIIGLIPYIEATGKLDFQGMIYFFEKTVYIFAITIPFDIRDLKLDKKMEVKTLPHKIGLKNSYLLAYILLTICILLIILEYTLDIYNLKMLLALIFGNAVSIILVRFSKNKSHDYYYAGLIDGSIAFIAVLGILSSGILSVIF